MNRRGLLVDYGGVLTTSVFESFERFAAAEALAPGAVPALLAADPAARRLLAGLETGRLAEARFEEGFAALLGVPAPGLIGRLLAAARPDRAMRETVRAAARLGVPTGLVSNSWGTARYPADGLRELFTGIVLSGDVGVRKPSREIYELGARSIGLEPAQCVFVDDLPANLAAAEALGMATVHHTDAAATAAALGRLLGLDLAPRAAEPGKAP